MPAAPRIREGQRDNAGSWWAQRLSGGLADARIIGSAPAKFGSRVRPNETEAGDCLALDRLIAQPVGLLQRGEAAKNTVECGTAVEERQEQQLRRDRLVTHCPRLYRHNGGGAVLGDGGGKRLDGGPVLVLPQVEEIRALQFPAIERADTGTGEAHDIILAIGDLEDEGVGEHPA